MIPPYTEPFSTAAWKTLIRSGRRGSRHWSMTWYARPPMSAAMATTMILGEDLRVVLPASR